MSDSKDIDKTFARAILAFCALFVGAIGGFVGFGNHYSALLHEYDIGFGDMDPGGPLFALTGGILGAATGTVLYFFCVRQYRLAGMIALVTWFLCLPMCFLNNSLFIRALFSVSQKSNALTHYEDALTHFEHDLFLPGAIWWIALLVCGIIGLVISFRQPKLVSS